LLSASSADFLVEKRGRNGQTSTLWMEFQALKPPQRSVISTEANERERSGEA
jgi:hypothetical protein